MAKRISIPIPRAIPKKHYIPDDGMQHLDTFASFKDYLAFEAGEEFDLPDELLLYLKSNPSVNKQKFRQYWDSFSGNTSDFLKFFRDYDQITTTVRCSTSVTPKAFDEDYDLALMEASGIPTELLAYWMHHNSIPASRFISLWQTFVGSNSDFTKFINSYYSTWTSLNCPAKLTKDALSIFTDLGTLELEKMERRLYNAECALFFGDDDSSEDADNIVYYGNSYDMDSYNELYRSRSDGNHARYIRRCKSAKHHQHEIQLGAAPIYWRDGTVKVQGGLCWQRYTYAKGVLKALKTWETFQYNSNNDQRPLTTEVAQAVKVLDSFGTITYHTRSSLVFIVQKYKNIVSRASNYTVYADGLYSVKTSKKAKSKNGRKGKAKEAPDAPYLEGTKKQRKKRFFVVTSAQEEEVSDSLDASAEDTQVKLKERYLNADYHMTPKANTVPLNVGHLNKETPKLRFESPQIPKVLPYSSIPETLYKHPSPQASRRI